MKQRFEQFRELQPTGARGDADKRDARFAFARVVPPPLQLSIARTPVLSLNRYAVAKVGVDAEENEPRRDPEHGIISMSP